jgi:hypothetical protein
LFFVEKAAAVWVLKNVSAHQRSRNLRCAPRSREEKNDDDDDIRALLLLPPRWR